MEKDRWWRSLPGRGRAGDPPWHDPRSGPALPLPLLSVTEEDARLSGISAEQLAGRWRPLLERRLRRARLLFSPQQMDARLRRSLLAFALLAGLLTLAAWLWTRSLRVIRLQIRHRALSGGRDRRRLKLAPLGSRLLTAAMLLLEVAMVAVVMRAWPGRLAQAVDVLRQPLAMLLKAVLGLLLVLVLRGLVNLLLLQWAGDAPSTTEGRGRGVLSTDLRCGDRQVLVLPNSACEKVLNHSKLLPPAEPG